MKQSNLTVQTSPMGHGSITSTTSVGSGVNDTTGVQLNEKKRTYSYARDGHVVDVVLENVTELIVRPSGDHRLKTADGQLHILPAGYIHIAIVDNGQWTV